jgi:hypothetical protein
MTCFFCMFWLGFVYPRSHSGWIGRIGEFTGAEFILKPAYRYSIPLSPDVHSIWRQRLAFLMPFRTSTIAWLSFCVFWLGFVYPRSHSGWIGRIGEFEGAVFIRKPAYRYSILLPPDLSLILRHRLAFSSEIVQSDSVTCFLYILNDFCIPVGWSDLFVLSFDCALYQTYRMLFSCYSLAGTEASKQALKTNLPKCNIRAWETSETQQQQSIYFARKTSDQSKY